MKSDAEALVSTFELGCGRACPLFGDGSTTGVDPMRTLSAPKFEDIQSRAHDTDGVAKLKDSRAGGYRISSAGESTRRLGRAVKRASATRG